MDKSFWAVDFISVVNKIIGMMVIFGGIAVTCVLGLRLPNNPEFHQLTGDSGWFVCLIPAIIGFLVGTQWIAIGQMLEIFLSIESNTRKGAFNTFTPPSGLAVVKEPQSPSASTAELQRVASAVVPSIYGGFGSASGN
jgi:hypothetical protein